MKKILSFILVVTMVVCLPALYGFSPKERVGVSSAYDETLTECFCEYLKDMGTYHDGSVAKSLWTYNGYSIFFGAFPECSPACHSVIIDNCIVWASNIYYPYSLGLYVYNGKDICTLEEAVEKGYFKMAQVVHLRPDFRLLYDVKHDDKLNMDDVVLLQRVAADIEQAPQGDNYHDISFSDLINHGTCLEAVVFIQRHCADL